jgi:ribosomal protein L11 methylase PrmA
VELNGLSRRIEVSDQAADTIDGSYDLVTANLRTPTLVCLARFLYTRITSQGALVLSGIRTEECRELLREFEKHYFNPVWRDEEQEWVGVALAKRR